MCLAGGTIDITVHEVLDDGSLKELHAASGNDMGGHSVDKNVLSFLKDIFSEEVFEKFEKDYPSEALQLKNDIALMKSFDDSGKLPCPVSLQTLAKDKKSMDSYFEDVEGAEWDDSGIYFEEQMIRSFFDTSFSATESKINEVLETSELNIEYILLVGGYAESPFLKSFIKEKFGSKHKILCPVDPQPVILKGAIKYAKTPKVLRSRISALTYGFGQCELFDQTKHRGKKTLINAKGQEFCDVCFEQMVSSGESVRCDEVRTFIRGPVEPLQTAVTIMFYSSVKQQVRFVDESDVNKICSLTVDIPNTDRGMDREVRLDMKFGSSEIQATATDLESGETRSTRLDFMIMQPVFKSP